MSCENNVCGTGDWSGPKPGDPDNIIAISASVVFGGVKVRWTYPNTNRAAVAHWTVYRGTTAVFTEATEVAVVSGSLYYDQLDIPTPTTFYYWVVMMSSNGTIFDPIGPASVTAQPRVKQTIESLAGMIDHGLLAQALRSDIGGILDNRNDILKEIQDRYGAESEIALALEQLQSNVDGAFTYIGTATAQHQSELEAMSARLDLTAAALGETKAVVAEESVTRATETSALAEKVTTVEVALNGNTVTGEVGLKAELDDVTGLVNGMYTAKVKVNGLIGGFGIANNGMEVEAGFDVNTFWIGRDKDGDPNTADGVYPFVVHDNKVYIREAVIREASIDTLMLQGEAVTVPVVASKEWAPIRLQGKGDKVFMKVNSAAINMVKPGLAYILVTGAHAINGNGNNWPWDFRLDVENSEGSFNVRSIGGRQPESAPVFSKVIALPAGISRVHVYWAADQRIELGYVEIFMMGVKK